MAIQPSNGHLWVGSINGGPQVIEYLIGANGGLTELRRVNLSSQGVDQNEISGLSFGADGRLYVGSTQGEIYKVLLP
jgi:outer membrane protein assembly factor BamB